jgi:osmotically-inducible protein OsmY
MADKYRGGENERYARRGRTPRSDEAGGDLGGRGYLERDSRGGRFNDTAGRRFSSFSDRSGYGGENYFGSGRQGYGDGIEDVEPNHAFGSSWRDSTGNSNYETPERRYESTERRAGFGRDAYGLGYGGDWEPEANRRREENRGSDRNRFEESYASQRDHGRNYPSSESGFNNDRNNDRGDNRSWFDKASDEVSSWFGGEPNDRDRYNEGRNGNHRGRGPKNYTRSDDRIREDINDRLTDHSYLDASDIDVAVEKGDVTLTGTVTSRYQKRMAEDIADDISGVKNVENRLRVQEQESNISSATGTTGNTETNATNTPATQTSTGTARGKTTSA